MVGKRSGATEPFNREKIVSGVRRACQGRPVTEDQLAILAQRVERAIRSRGLGEVPSHEVGLAILGPLRTLDEVAYLRFASVYRGFESLDDFEAEIVALRAKRDEKWRAAVAELDGDRVPSERAGDDGKAVAWQSAGRDGTLQGGYSGTANDNHSEQEPERARGGISGDSEGG